MLLIFILVYPSIYLSIYLSYQNLSIAKVQYLGHANAYIMITLRSAHPVHFEPCGKYNKTITISLCNPLSSMTTIHIKIHDYNTHPGSPNKLCPLVASGILYMDHPKDQPRIVWLDFLGTRPRCKLVKTQWIWIGQLHRTTWMAGAKDASVRKQNHVLGKVHTYRHPIVTL